MTEEAKNTPEAPAFAVQRIYVKDMSFESPNAPLIFLQEWEPKIGVEMDNAINQIDEHSVDVQLKVTVTAHVQDKVAYIAEVVQGGIFIMRGFSEEEHAQLTGSFCPSTLYPYARQALSDLITKGSFPPFLLAPVNFDYIYSQHRTQQEKQSASA